MANDPVVQELYEAFVEEVYWPHVDVKTRPHSGKYLIPDDTRKQLQGFRAVLVLKKHPLLYEDLKWE